jgi:hypothetical protein
MRFNFNFYKIYKINFVKINFQMLKELELMVKDFAVIYLILNLL